MGIQTRRAKDGKPRYQVRIDKFDPLTGKRGHVTIGTYRTKREAKEAEAKAKLEQARGTLLDPSKATVGEVLDRWLATEAPRTVRPENLDNYEIIVRKHIKPALGHILVQKLTVEQVETFYARLQSEGKSSSLIKKCHLRLSSALNLAKRWKLVSENVCDVVKVPRVAYKKPTVWTFEETAHFLEVAAEDGLHPYWALAVETGARTSELLGVSWEDIDWTRGTITFGTRAIRLLKGTPIIKRDAKTEAGRRTVRLTAGMLEDLRQARQAWEQRRETALHWDNPDSLIFCTRTGRPINPAHVRRAFARLIELAGVRRITPHNLRSSHITAMVAGGGNLKAVAARVGHRDPTTTLKIYTQLVPQMEEELQMVAERVIPSRKRSRKLAG